MPPIRSLTVAARIGSPIPMIMEGVQTVEQPRGLKPAAREEVLRREMPTLRTLQGFYGRHGGTAATYKEFSDKAYSELHYRSVDSVILIHYNGCFRSPRWADVPCGAAR